MNNLSVCYKICCSCNRQCSYCMNNYVCKKPQENKLYKLVLTAINSFNRKLHLDITGGEPTSCTNFIDIFRYACNLPNIQKIILSTNGNPDFDFSMILKSILKVEINLIIVSVHLEHFDSRVFNTINALQPTNLEVRIPYLPRYYSLVLDILKKLQKYSLYKLILLPIIHPSIKYTEKDRDFIRYINKSDEAFLPETKGKFCISSGLNIVPDGKWNMCNSSKIYNKPIFLYKSIENTIMQCNYHRCFQFSENHRIFNSLQEANLHKNDIIF